MTCPDPASCRVLRPGAHKALRSYVIEAGTQWYNVSRRDEVFNSGAAADSRFAPLLTPDGETIPYIYLAQNVIGALLETALHDVWGASPAVQQADLRGRRLRRIVCTADLRVVDLRDHQLAGCGFERAELVSSPSEHYTCTRRWAAHHLQSSAAGQTSAGMIWQSRQMELAAVHAKPPLQVLMTSVEQATRTVVVYDTAGEGDRRFDASIEYADLGQGAGLEMVTGLCAELGLYVEAGPSAAAVSPPP